MTCLFSHFAQLARVLLAGLLDLEGGLAVRGGHLVQRLVLATQRLAQLPALASTQHK